MMEKIFLTFFLFIHLFFTSSVFSASLPTQQEVVSRAYEKNITKYDNIDDFQFDVVISREQAAAMILRFFYGVDLLRQEPTSTDVDCTNFIDQEQIDDSLKDDIISACRFGLFKGYKGMFMPRSLLIDTDITTVMQRAAVFNEAINLANIGTLLTETYMPYSRGQLVTLFYHINTENELRVNGLKNKELVGIQSDLEKAKSIWLESNITTYQVTLELLCYCDPHVTTPKKYLIDHGQLSGAVMTFSGNIYTGEGEFFAVEGMFDLIQQAIDKKSERIEVVYNVMTGYPQKIYINEFAGISDDEFTYVIFLEEPK